MRLFLKRHCPTIADDFVYSNLIFQKMKKSAIIALIALATSAAVYAGNGNKKSKHKAKAKTDCCDKTKCCPTGTSTCKWQFFKK